VPVVGLFGKEDSLLRAAPNYEEKYVIRSTAYGAPVDPVGSDRDRDRSLIAVIPPEPVLGRLTALAG
jgi:hypothetical protein